MGASVEPAEAGRTADLSIIDVHDTHRTDDGITVVRVNDIDPKDPLADARATRLTKNVTEVKSLGHLV